MVRFPSTLRASRRPPVSSPIQNSRNRLLRRLVEENLALTRELDELRFLRRMAHRDSLTGLPNRRLFEHRLAEELSRSATDVTGQGALVVVDVKGLKLVNDRHGHGVGDDLLRDVAAVLRTALRGEDVCCRTGGDEFMILLPETDGRGARMVMARLRVAAIRAGSRRNIPVSISVGCSSWPSDGRHGPTLVKKADLAMNVEKRRLQRLARRLPPPAGTKLSLVK